MLNKLLKIKPHKWLMWPFAKKKNFWEKYESLWVILFSLLVVSSIAFGFKTLIEPEPITEEIYINPSAFKYQERDFFIAKKNRKNNPSPFTLISYLKKIEKLNPFTTTAAQAEVPFEKIAATPNSSSTKELVLIPEPNIRIGLTSTLNPVVITNSQPFSITNLDNKPLLKLAAGDRVTLKYNNYNSTYLIITPELNIKSDSALILKADNQKGVFTLENYYNPPPWNWRLNDNSFRGQIDFIYTPATKKIWIVNELPMEEYLKGLAETTAFAPLEYLKIMTIAARSYALWHRLEQHKYQYEFYDVQANQNDQVYRGYKAEIRHPNLSKAVKETRGVVATYKNNLAIIPYFAGSSGRTYSWENIWGSKDYPWVQTQRIPEEKGYTRLGHGVGLSQRGALLKVKNGETKEEVFADFFPEIRLQNIYVP